MAEGVRESFATPHPASDIYDEMVITADSGFHTEETMKLLVDAGIDAYVADRKFRQRDADFASAQDYKRKTVDRRRTSTARKYYRPEDFHLDERHQTLICPAGKDLRRSVADYRDKAKGYRGTMYIGQPQNCLPCELRAKCLRNAHTRVRQVTKFVKGIRGETKSYTQRMLERFDSERGRMFYRKRMGTVEPVFANICATLGLDRFTLRGQRKVNMQWQLFCIVHNIGKICRYV